MDYSNLLFACSAALFAGGLNSIAGGGTFITLPALLSAGMSPVMANTTSASVMFPGYLGSVLGFRDVLSSVSRKYLFILVVCLIFREFEFWICGNCRYSHLIFKISQTNEHSMFGNTY